MCVNQSVTVPPEAAVKSEEENGQMYKNGDKSSLKSVPSLYALLEIGSSQSTNSVQIRRLNSSHLVVKKVA